MRTKTELDSLILDDKCFVGLYLPERQSLSQALIAASIVALTVRVHPSSTRIFSPTTSSPRVH